MKVGLTAILAFIGIAKCFSDDRVTQEFVAVAYRGNSSYAIVGNSAVSAGGAIVRAGDTFLTPQGAYVRAGDSFLKPSGGAVVSVDGVYIGTDSALAKVSKGSNLILVGSDGASIGAGATVLRPLFLPH